MLKWRVMNPAITRNRDGAAKCLIGAALVAATVLVYCRTFDHRFINFDDREYVEHNPNVWAGLTPAGVKYAFTTFDCGNWHPLTWLSLELDAQIYHGWNAQGGGFHLTNVVLHLGNTLLLFLILDRLTGLMWRSAAVAALFALHPLHVESVAWVAERKDVLSTFFGLLTVAAYAFVYAPRPSLLRYALVALLLAFGLLAKPMLVTLPFVLLLLDYWPLQRWDAGGATASRRRLVLEKVPLLALAAASGVLTVLANEQGRALATFQDYPLGVRVGNALIAYVDYLAKTFWPLNLAVYYPHPGSSVSAGRAALSGLLLAVITGLVWKLGRRRPYLTVGWLWYLGTLVPVIGLVQVGGQAMADRYTYVPSIGLLVMLVWGLDDLLLAWRVPRFVPAAATALALAGCAVVSWEQVGLWESDIALWDRAVAVTGPNCIARCNRGEAYFHMAMVDLARQEFEQAVAIEPRYVQAHQNLGYVLRMLGKREEAESAFRRVIELDPAATEPHCSLAAVLQEMGRPDDAFAEYKRAIDLAPQAALPHYGLGVAYQSEGRLGPAEAEYRRSLDLNPNLAEAHHNLGALLADTARRTEGLVELRRAVELQPYSAASRENLGMVLQEEGQLREAMRHFQIAESLGNRTAGVKAASCTRFLVLVPRLPALVRGEYQPAGTTELIDFALLCRQPFERRYRLAARLFAEALLAQPALADGWLRPRFHAACAAALAGCGQGEDAAALNDQEKVELRGRALAWLRAEAAVHIAEAVKASPLQHRAARQTLRQWQRDAAFQGVREPASLAKLPPPERETWRQLWAEIETACAKPQAPPAEGPKPSGS